MRVDLGGYGWPRRSRLWAVGLVVSRALMTTPKPFEGEITVSSRIVDYLSSGLYESPAACLKELVNNSYDADATLVEVFVKPDADRIIIADNGHGMDRTEFLRHFSRIRRVPQAR